MSESIFITIGNSHIRMAYIKNQPSTIPITNLNKNQPLSTELFHAIAIPTAELKVPNDIAKIISNLLTESQSSHSRNQLPKSIFVVSVVPTISQILYTYASKYNIPLYFFTTDFYPFPIIPNPKQLGGDRLTLCLGAKLLGYQPPLCLIDIGTAITINFIAEDFTFLGGMIAPSPHLMARALHDFTATLPMLHQSIPLQQHDFIADNTASNMVKGIGSMTCAWLNTIGNLYTQRHKNATILITGGGYQIDSSLHLKFHPIYEPNLSLAGLAYFAHHLPPKK